MRCPSVASLLKAFPRLEVESARLIRRLAKVVDDPERLRKLVREHCIKTQVYVDKMFSSPYDSKMWRTTVALHAIDVALGTYGVEPLWSERDRVDTLARPLYEYCNAGDTYAATLIYKTETDNLFISSWGDVVEHDRRLQSKER